VRHVVGEQDRRRAGSGGARRRQACVAVLAATLLVVLGISAATGAAARPARTCSNAYFNGDSRLGPAQLQDAGAVAPMVAGYDRLAGLTAQQFIARYWDPAANTGSGGWRYPPADGFLLRPTGQPIEFVAPLGPGTQVDRFGSEFGAFLAPLDTPYAERALPPMSLDNFDAAYTCNYHVYRVIKRFSAEEGPIAPAFGQIGHGLQIELLGSLVPGAPRRLDVRWLIDNGYLQRAN
jgi:hypothetical protein